MDPPAPSPTPIRRMRVLTDQKQQGEEDEHLEFHRNSKKAPLTLTEQSIPGNFVPAYRSTWAGFRVREGMEESWTVPTLQAHRLRDISEYRWWDVPIPRQKHQQLCPLPQPKVLPDRPVWTKPPDALSSHYRGAARGPGLPYRTQRLQASPGLRFPTPQPYRDPYAPPFVTYMGVRGGQGF